MTSPESEVGKEILLAANEAGDVKSKTKLWQQRMNEINEANKHNPFSREFDGHHDVVDKEHYGHPVEGSLTDIRGKEAAKWVDHEVDRLCQEIKKIGQYDPIEGGICTCTFGDLFVHYQDISNTVVGILMRAKKRKRVKYVGEMLYQHSCKDVKITVLIE